MLICEFRVVSEKFGYDLANYHDVEDDRLLSLPVGKKIAFAHPLGVGADELAGFQHVIEVVIQALRCHTGRAWESTYARNFGGRSPGYSDAQYLADLLASRLKNDYLDHRDLCWR